MTNSADLVRRFPDGFLWGAATSAYQIEGAVDEDGRTPSIWDTFSRLPGKIRDGATADIAADHYHRCREDVAMMAELGLPAYRFSVSWSRVMPHGRGPVNQAGLDFYSRLVDALLEGDIVPMLTLYHWDLPQGLQDAGGWPARETALRFADYAEQVGRAVGDRVPHWTTLNEPWCSAYLGYFFGLHAPGHRDGAAALAAAHHLNLAHGLAVRVLQELLPPSAVLSVALNLHHTRPADRANEDDVDAARQVDAVCNRVFLDPMLRGKYPADLWRDTAQVTDWSFVQPGDEQTIAAPIDLLGVNYYVPKLVRRVPASGPDPAGSQSRTVGGPGTPWLGCDTVEFLPASTRTTPLGWHVDPSGLTELLQRLDREYGLPLMVMENGVATVDEPGPDGAVHDPDRVQFLFDHLEALGRALDAGVDVRGYLAWTLLDNFEWSYGYSTRFGLVRVDFDGCRRTWKDSARWYREVIRTNTLQPVQ